MNEMSDAKCVVCMSGLEEATAFPCGHFICGESKCLGSLKAQTV